MNLVEIAHLQDYQLFLWSSEAQSYHARDQTTPGETILGEQCGRKA